MPPPLIAVVDDDAPFRELMDDLLHEEGYRTVCCAKTRDGLATVWRMQPDVLILDLWMETRDTGWQLLDHLRRDPRTAALPVLVCSADHAGLAAHAGTLRARECSVLAKPFGLDDLTAAVDTLLTARCTPMARR